MFNHLGQEPKAFVRVSSSSERVSAWDYTYIQPQRTLPCTLPSCHIPLEFRTRIYLVKIRRDILTYKCCRTGSTMALNPAFSVSIYSYRANKLERRLNGSVEAETDPFTRHNP